MEVIDDAILEAIRAGARAGVFRTAQRLNIKTASLWGELADPHSERARLLLGQVIARATVTRSETR